VIVWVFGVEGLLLAGESDGVGGGFSGRKTGEEGLHDFFHGG